MNIYAVCVVGLEKCMQLYFINVCMCLTELLSQILSVLSSEADTSRLESDDQDTSEIP